MIAALPATPGPTGPRPATGRTGTSGPHEGLGRVVVNRAVSVDGFVAGPDDAMGWVFEHLTNDTFPEVMAATGAVLAGRRTHEVGRRLAAEAASEGRADYDGGPLFVLTHRPPVETEPGVTYLSTDLRAAVATARAAAGGKDLEVLGADLASQCLRAGLVDEVLVYVLPVLLGDGVRFSTAGLGRVDLEPTETRRSGAVTLLRFRVRRPGPEG